MRGVGARVRTSHVGSYRTYGARRVWHDLLAEGISCGLHRIERLSQPVGDFLNESLLIIGWMANWRPAVTFLYDWRPLKQQQAILDALSVVDIHFRHNADEQHLVARTTTGGYSNQGEPR